jgi:nicotinate-nucleotide adenylyltransferase
MFQQRSDHPVPVNIGVLGGTFDPIHKGHLHIALKSQEIFGLSKVFFVVAQTPPHKRNDNISSAYHRFAMVALATAPYPDFMASPLELESNSSPYTVDTLQRLCRQLDIPPYSIFFLAGGDSFQSIHTWKDYETLLTAYNVLFVERPDARIEDATRLLPPAVCQRFVDLRAKGLHAQPPEEVRQGRQRESRVYLLDIDAPDVSSTAVRCNSTLVEARRHWVTETVANYINKYRLYET